MSRSNHRTETLDYLQSMLRELVLLAQSERYDILAYMIEMAYIECSDVIRGERPHRLPAPTNGSNEERAETPEQLAG
ncbi:hypothetical protein [Notoacmeibacter ruber]|uniref:Uncharacterized protein n=1 Tax=Notoacmeibacter ruber TaxID=2670375 RepID=A0A3L7JAR4_9HYPH|nr:hypothetical protein [Notoacmeibacter ruber]RLQ87716.1 hypothetical protein D8780_05350 [Notoacmeibacter ruber]